MWLNHVYKLFRLYEKGVFPEKEWENVARESADIFAMGGELMQAFRMQNHYFDDLYKELDQYPAGDFTSLKFLKEDA